jgi:hypothetical protein
MMITLPITPSSSAKHHIPPYRFPILAFSRRHLQMLQLVHSAWLPQQVKLGYTPEKRGWKVEVRMFPQT